MPAVAIGLAWSPSPLSLTDRSLVIPSDCPRCLHGSTCRVASWPGGAHATHIIGRRREAIEGVEEGPRRLCPREGHLTVDEEAGDVLDPGPASPRFRRTNRFEPVA